MPLARYENAIPTVERPQTHALVHAATGTAKCSYVDKDRCASDTRIGMRTDSLRTNGVESKEIESPKLTE
jgi:hypothetical protein